MWTEAVVTNCDASTEEYIPILHKDKMLLTTCMEWNAHRYAYVHSVSVTEGPLAFRTPKLYCRLKKNGTGICPEPD